MMNLINPFTLLCIAVCILAGDAQTEVDLGDGLSYLTTYMPDDCTHRARANDVIHYHYVGRLGDTGEVFGRSFDYNSPYIVSLGQGRIIAGMDRGLMGTCLWERRRITIPPELGYGERGVGDTIPPNSTLVFFIRMIKIERNGQVLGHQPTLSDLWSTAMVEYTAENWQKAVDTIELALKVFEEYEFQTMTCIKECRLDNVPVLKEKEQEAVDRFVAKDPFAKQFLAYASKSKCMRQCKRGILPHHIQEPDASVLQKFRTRLPYSYLQYAYYKLGNAEEGVKCAYTFYFHNPNDTMIKKSIDFYKRQTEVSTDGYPSREPGMMLHQQKYEQSKTAYGEEKWLPAAELLEEAINEYMKANDDCVLMCNDVIYVNLTDPDMPESTYKLLEEMGFLPDSMEYTDLLKALIKEYLECRTSCPDKMATINGQYYEKYLPGHFNHLQYAYFKLGMVHKSAAAASTFKVLEPSDIVMSNNIRYYRTSLKVPFESFKARDDVIELLQRQEDEERLLSFIKTGRPMKKTGSKGDNGDMFTRDEL